MSSTISPNPRRGEVWDVDFNPAVGAEIQKTCQKLLKSLRPINLRFRKNTHARVLWRDFQPDLFFCSFLELTRMVRFSNRTSLAGNTVNGARRASTTLS